MKAMSYRQRLAQVHAALGHARRLKIIDVLQENPQGLTFEEIGWRCKINASTLGHHVRCLMAAGFLDKTIKGPYSIFRFDPEPMDLIVHAPALKQAA